MENQFSQSNVSVSNITALSNVKEVAPIKNNTLNILVLIIMVVFVGLLVFLSVYKFDVSVKPQVAHATSAYNNQIQQLAK